MSNLVNFRSSSTFKRALGVLLASGAMLVLAGAASAETLMNHPKVVVGQPSVTIPVVPAWMYRQGYMKTVDYWWYTNPSRHAAWDYDTQQEDIHPAIPVMTAQPGFIPVMPVGGMVPQRPAMNIKAPAGFPPADLGSVMVVRPPHPDLVKEMNAGPPAGEMFTIYR
ncbi:MAG: hypothetical protein HQL56_13745 [Magnetococcales bacterium]|nr:hypothetical protein [Magnetococcales bacterium]